MSKHSFTTEVEIDPQMVADLMVTAIEGGSNYWVGSITLKDNDGHPNHGQPWYSDSALYERAFHIEVYEMDDMGALTEVHYISQHSMQVGLNAMASKAPGHFANVVSDQWDAETADVFLQYVVLGDIVYG